MKAGWANIHAAYPGVRHNRAYAARGISAVVGQRQMGIRQHLEDRVPVVEELAAERGGLRVLGTSHILAPRAELGEIGREE
jgi:hypothetical protein